MESDGSDGDELLIDDTEEFDVFDQELKHDEKELMGSRPSVSSGDVLARPTSTLTIADTDKSNLEKISVQTSSPSSDASPERSLDITIDKPLKSPAFTFGSSFGPVSPPESGNSTKTSSTSLKFGESPNFLSLSTSKSDVKTPVTIRRTIKGLCAKSPNSVVTNGVLKDSVAFKFGSSEHKIVDTKQSNKIFFGKSQVQNNPVTSKQTRVGFLPSSTITSGAFHDPQLEKMEQIRQNYIDKIAKEKEEKEMVEIMIAQKKEAMVFGKNGETGKEGLQKEMEEVRRMKEQVIQEKRLLEAQKKVFELEKQVNEMKKARSVKERVGTVKSQWDLKQGLSARKRITMGTRGEGDSLDNSNKMFRKEVKSDWSRRNRDFVKRRKFESNTRREGGGSSIPDDLVLTEITDHGPVKKEEYVAMETNDEEDDNDHRTSSRRRQW